MIITVVGLGKIGLPLAVQFANKKAKVYGCDISRTTVDLVNEGSELFPEEINLQSYLSLVVSEGNLIASTDTAYCVSRSEVVVVVVPLFVDDVAEPDFKAIDSATRDIAKGLKRGTLVSYETTLPVGTTRNRFTKALEEGSGFKVGVDFYVAFSPERVLTGRVFTDLKKYPKIIGGVTKKCARVAEDFYSKHLDFDLRHDLPKENGVWVLDSAESAEFVKLAETTYRDVNIGLANQFAKFADKLDLNIYEVIEASNSQPFSHIHQPGVAVGGHCIPIYPKFYLWGDPGATIVSAAREVNAGMPEYVVASVDKQLQSHLCKKILILGASYRDKVKELAFSGVFSLNVELLKLGYEVEVYDPLFTEEELLSNNLKSMTSKKDEFAAVIIQTSSSEFKDMFSKPREWKSLVAIFDGRNLFEGISPIRSVNLIGIGHRGSNVN